MIDLGKLQPVVMTFLKDSLHGFVKKHPDARVSCLGVFAQGYYGSMSVFADTVENVQKELAQHDQMVAMYKKDRGNMSKEQFRRWIQILEANGKDSIGRFATNCHGYEFAISEMNFPLWPEPHKETKGEVGRWDFRWPDGRITKADPKEGDRGIDHELFPFLVACVEALDTSVLKTEAVFRVGVEMHDQTFVKFWVPRAQQPKGYRPFEYCFDDLGS